jgi:hypothetical protein
MLHKNKLGLAKGKLLVITGGILTSEYVKYPNKGKYWSKENDIPALLADSI